VLTNDVQDAEFGGCFGRANTFSENSTKNCLPNAQVVTHHCALQHRLLHSAFDDDVILEMHPWPAKHQ
jgi:hypothetical protein